ncbi:DUF4199 domain-containing protein [Tunicatimonas pelagia]|uniref:DUF4199 domain-containing protein n=1 Tax=Tunicatimonas pelagia TaxID=931531 RepID=UPI0026671776|nr:DUF4199 domain-containing protein [Tunicatimonas pelagia]WKN41198.1 DUF4199 domain-containing protein [Tunicatimonas pelagia]
MNHSVRYGLILGALNVAFTAGVFLIDYKLIQNPLIGFLIFGITIAVLFIAGFELRKKNGGYLTFKNALASSFVIYAIAAVLVVTYNVLQYNVFTPEIAQELQKEALNQQVAVWESFGMSDEQIDENAAAMEDRNLFGLTWQLVGLAGNLFFGLIISLVVAAIIKKKEPEFD